jgi:hypothetical protein
MKKLNFTFFRKSILLIVSLFFSVGIIHSQVGYQGNVASQAFNSNTSTLTLSSFNVPAGTNRVLIVYVGLPSSGSISDVTFNGSVSLTKEIEQNGGNERAELWYANITGTSSVTGNIVANLAASKSNIVMAAASYTGANTTDPIGATNSQGSGGNVNSGNRTVSTSNGDMVIDLIRRGNGNAGPFTFGAGQTEIYDTNSQHANNGGSYKASTGGNVTMSWSSPGRSGNAAYIVAAINWDGVTLPIELKYFEARPTATSVHLEWQTASEINNDFFTVERSTDRVNYEPIGKVIGAGTSYNNLTYSLEDTHLPKNATQLYYRLRQTDFDGVFEYSDVVVVDRVVSLNKVLISPNPVQNGELTLYIPDEDMEEATLEIFNTVGQLVQTEVLTSNQATIRVNDLSKGMYLFSLNTNGQRSVEKVIIK